MFWFEPVLPLVPRVTLTLNKTFSVNQGLAPVPGFEQLGPVHMYAGLTFLKYAQSKLRAV